MDDERFYELSRGLAAPTTRRGVLRGLLFSALGVGAVLSPAAAEAAPKPPKPPKCIAAGSKCNSGSPNPPKCCNDAPCCGSAGTCCNSVAGQPDICLNGSCCAYLRTCGNACCPTGTACCNRGTSAAFCTDIFTDAKNCGDCGHACPANALCDNAKCVCLSDTVPCGDQCIDPQTDDTHCGGCPGVACGPGWECCGGQCIDPQTSNIHCGGCPGVNCAFTKQVCCNGTCVDDCPTGWTRDANCVCICPTGQVCGDMCCAAGEKCKPNAQTGVPECCPADRTNDNLAFCCPPNRIACGAVCCGDAGWTCCSPVPLCAPSPSDCPT